MCVGVTLWFGWGGVVSGCRLKHYSASACIRIPHSTNKSQASEDGCINIRNMLSVKKRNNKASDTKLVSLYSIIRVVKSNNDMVASRHVPHVGRREVNTEFWWGYLREKAHLKDLRVDGEIILKLILKNYFGELWD